MLNLYNFWSQAICRFWTSLSFLTSLPFYPTCSELNKKNTYAHVWMWFIVFIKILVWHYSYLFHFGRLTDYHIIKPLKKAEIEHDVIWLYKRALQCSHGRFPTLIEEHTWVIRSFLLQRRTSDPKGNDNIMKTGWCFTAEPLPVSPSRVAYHSMLG